MNAQVKPNDGIIVIHNKEYQTVALRVSKLREVHPDWTIGTEIVLRDPECVVMKATITNEEGRVLATGHAEEYRESSSINRTSALENCETSAIGRALASAGYGGTEFASADELKRAIVDKQAAKSYSPGQIAWTKLDEKQKNAITDHAAVVLDYLNQDLIAEAVGYIERKKADMDENEYGALWSRFSSCQRSAMSKEYDAKRKG